MSAWSGLLLVAVAGVAGGCSAAREPRGAARVESPGAPVGGETPRQDYDPTRAFLTLDRIEPVPPPPGPASPENRPLTARGAGYLQEAEQLLAEERYAEATRALEKALRSDPAAYEVQRALALAAYGAGNRERVRAHAAEAVRLNADNPVAHYLLGRTASEEGNYDDALRHFRTGLSCTHPESAPAFVVLAEFYLAKTLEAAGYLTAAVQAYEAFEDRAAALREAPPGAEEPRALARAVPQELTTLLRVNQGSAAEPIALLEERLGRFTEAAKALGRWVDQVRPDPETRLRYARLLVKAQRYDDALAQGRLVVDEAADPEKIVALLTDLRRKMGTPRTALDDVRAIVQRRPDDRTWLLAYADLLRRFEEDEQAEQVLADYVSAHPEASDVGWRLCDDYVRAGRGERAFELAARLLTTNPRDYGEALMRLDAWSSDVRLTAALLARVQPETPAERYLLGVLALRTGQMERGTDLLRSALATAPDYVPARLALAEQLLSEYRWQEVVDLLEAGARPDPSLEWALGEAYAGLDADEAAAEHYSAAIRLNRADTRSMFALAQLYERTDAPLRAQRQYEALLELNPLHEKAREALVGLLLASRLFDDAEAQVRTLVKLAASPNAVARCTVRVQLARGGGEVEGSRRTLLEAMAQGGPDADSLVLVASLDLARDEPVAAEPSLDRALEIAPNHLDGRELRVWTYRRELRFAEAAAELRSLLRRHPNRGRWVRNLFEVLLIEQQYDEAAESVGSFLERVRPAGGALHDFRLNLLQALQAAKRFDQQIATVQTWLAADETNRELRGWLVAALLAAHDDTAAQRVARQWYQADPADAPTAKVYREVLVETGRFAAAEQLVLEALENDPGNAGLQLALIGVLGKAGQSDAALELVESLSPGAAQPVAWLAAQLDLYQAAKRYDEAAGLAARMLQDDALLRGVGTWGETYLRERLTGVWIAALLSGGRYDEAQVKLTRWIEQAASPDDKFGYLRLLAGVYQERGQAAEALESLELAYSLDPTEAGINNDLGYTLAEKGERLDEAERMVRKAVAREPMNAAYLDSLGWVLYRRGRFEEAKTWLLKAARTPEMREDPVIYDHLGDACWRVGAADEAAAYWKKAVELAEARRQEREDASDRRVAESAAAKGEATESGRSPQVAPVVGEKREEGQGRPAADRE